MAEQLIDLVLRTMKGLKDQLSARIDTLEQRLEQKAVPGPKGDPGERGADGINGKDGAPGADGSAGPAGPIGEKGEKGDPGKDADVTLLLQMKADIASMQAEWLAFKTWQAETQTTAAPLVIDADLVSRIKSAVLAEIPTPKDGKDGQSIDPSIVDVMVAAQVERAVKAIEPREGPPGPTGPAGPQGERGERGEAGLTGERGERGEKGEPGARGSDGLPGERGEKGVDGASGRDGVGVSEALLNRDGHLVLTYTDGSTKDVGPVVGRDVDDAMVLRRVEDQVKALFDAMPKPKDGVDGRDGLGFETSALTLDPIEGWQLELRGGDRVVKHALPLPFDAGTYTLGKKYPKGALVNAKGLWIAHAETRDKPGESRDWRLLVRNGRDGRDGKDLTRTEASDA